MRKIQIAPLAGSVLRALIEARAASATGFQAAAAGA